ncbi:polysaccharide deacetylase family protein [Streptomyces sp. B21-105]|uniref:polysaccharide deacetylase family protein n=1 Tax=Streptomyces sp. B21-105 TaxID=3039417 RepID=UPI003FA6D413
MPSIPLVALGAVVVLVLTTLSGCAQSVDPIERLGRKAAARVHPASSASPADAAGSAGSAGAPGRAAGQPAYRRWGLTAPLTPAPARPARPARSPAGSPGTALPPVVDHVPTDDRVVFLTYDDGAERDPRFVDMVRELRLPVSMFLTDSVIGPGYGRLARLQSVGASVQNHTLDHPALRGLPYAGQRAEICGQQDKLRARFGQRPRLLRPPYGVYDTTTRRAAADCGIAAVVLWRASMGPTGLTYAHGPHRLRPGDVIAVAPDETTAPDLKDRTTRLLRQIQQGHLTVARLEDYV